MAYAQCCTCHGAEGDSAYDSISELMVGLWYREVILLRQCGERSPTPGHALATGQEKCVFRGRSGMQLPYLSSALYMQYRGGVLQGSVAEGPLRSRGALSAMACCHGAWGRCLAGDPCARRD